MGDIAWLFFSLTWLAIAFLAGFVSSLNERVRRLERERILGRRG